MVIWYHLGFLIDSKRVNISTVIASSLMWLHTFLLFTHHQINTPLLTRKSWICMKSLAATGLTSALKGLSQAWYGNDWPPPPFTHHQINTPVRSPWHHPLTMKGPPHCSQLAAKPSTGAGINLCSIKLGPALRLVCQCQSESVPVPHSNARLFFSSLSIPFKFQVCSSWKFKTHTQSQSQTSWNWNVTDTSTLPFLGRGGGECLTVCHSVVNFFFK